MHSLMETGQTTRSITKNPVKLTKAIAVAVEKILVALTGIAMYSTSSKRRGFNTIQYLPKIRTTKSGSLALNVTTQASKW